MAYFKLNRNYKLISLSGHTVEFVKGEKTFVPNVVVPEVVAIGGERLDDEQDAHLPEEVAAPAELSSEERTAKLYDTFRDMMKRNVRGDFTGQGLPNIKALSKQAGFEVENKERDDAWYAFLALEENQK